MGMSTQNMSDGGKRLYFTKEGPTEILDPLDLILEECSLIREREELKEIFREVMSEYGLIRMED